MDLTHRYHHLLAGQAGTVVARRQLHEVGVSDEDIRSLLRRRQLFRVAHGVYVTHSGSPTEQERWWVALLAGWPAALAGESALQAAGLRGLSPSDVELIVPRGHRPVVPSWVQVTQRRDFSRVTQESPIPRVCVEDAVIQLAARARSHTERAGWLTRAVGARLTTAQRLADHLSTIVRVSHRTELRALIADLEAGTQSALEWVYLHRVERAHRLPAGQRQRRRMDPQLVIHDVSYGGSLVIELDGQAFHASAAARSRDADRDLRARALEGITTQRLTWHQVADQPCATAALLILLLSAHGVDTRRARRCGPTCGVGSAQSKVG